MKPFELKTSIRRVLEEKYQGSIIKDATLAIVGNEDGIVTGSRPNHIWVKYGTGPAIEVLNKKVAVTAGMLVYVGYDPVEQHVLQVLSQGTIASEYTPDIGYGGGNPINPGGIGLHGLTHSFYGSDPAFLWIRQIMDGRIGPASLQLGSPTLEIWPALIKYPDASYGVLAHQTYDMGSLVPVSGSSVYVGVTVSGSGAEVTMVSGSVASTNPPPLSMLPATPANAVCLGYVRLFPGMVRLNENAIYGTDILDARSLFSSPMSGSPGGGSGFTNPMSAQGDIIIGGPGGSAMRLAKGSDNKVLTIVSGSPGWATPISGMVNPMTSAGDIIIGGASGTPGRLGGGSAGQVLSMVASGSPGWQGVLSVFPIENPNYMLAGPASGSAPAQPTFRAVVSKDILPAHGAAIDSLTGFTLPDSVTVNYDSSTQKVTLTGTVVGYYQGGIVAALTSGWVSPAHTNTTGHEYFLYYDGANFTWATDTEFALDKLLIAHVHYGASDKYALKETHGLMDWRTHEDLHNTVGAFLYSGGTLDPASYTLASTTATNRRPDVVATVIHDEDLPSSLPALTSKLYTKFFLTAGGTDNYTVETAEIIPVSGNQPYYNQFTGGAWQQTLLTANTYTSVWLVAIPVASDSTSQKYRYLWIQGQSAGTLAGQTALTPSSLNTGSLRNEVEEFVFLAHIIINYQSAGGGNWVITSVTALSGSHFSQVGAPTGFLSEVSTDATLVGNGTSGSLLGVANLVRPTVTSPIVLSGSPNFIGANPVNLSMPAASGSAPGYMTAAQVTTLNSLSAGSLINPMNALGDLIFGGASGVPTRLQVGHDGYPLVVSSGSPVWDYLPLAGIHPVSAVGLLGNNVVGLGQPIVLLDTGTVLSLIGAAPSARNINTTAPLTGGGNLSSDRTIAMPAAASGSPGYMTAAQVATLAAAVPGSRSISTTAPITGGGDLTGDRTFAMAAATGANDGYMTAAQAGKVASALQNFYMPFMTYGVLAPYSANSSGTHICTLSATYIFVSFNITVYVQTTNNSTNYWNITIKNAAGTQIIMVSTWLTANVTAGQWTVLTGGAFDQASQAASDKQLSVTIAKAGTGAAPGNLYLGSPNLLAHN